MRSFVTSPAHRPCTAALALLLLGGGCAPLGGGVGVSDLEASLAPEVSTVVELSWTTELSGDSWVEYGAEGGPVHSTPLFPNQDAHHSATLYGMPPLTLVHYEVFTQAEGGLLTASGDIETGGAPSGLPEFKVLIYDVASMSSEPHVLATVAGAETYLVVLDRLGRVLWYRALRHEHPSLVPLSLGFDLEGRGLFAGAFFQGLPEPQEDFERPISQALTYDLQGELLDATELPGAHHDLVQLPDGGLATILYDPRAWVDPEQGKEVLVSGDALVEITPAGEAEALFSTWDWAEPVVHESFYMGSDKSGDWTHANGLSYNPASNSYLLSLGNMDTVLEIDAGSGELLRQFGGVGGYQVEDEEPFRYQHDAHWSDEGTLLLTTSLPHEDRVMAVEYQVDDTTGTLRELWEFGRYEGFHSIAGGTVRRLENGNTVLNTGYGGQVVEVDPSGAPVWELAVSMGGAFMDIAFFHDFYEGQ